MLGNSGYEKSEYYAFDVRTCASPIAAINRNKNAAHPTVNGVHRTRRLTDLADRRLAAHGLVVTG
ncbi:hypothetical protein EGJ56_16250 [Pandoraea apista]|nr:hypothetical protein EGJ56_16250 [Pandoraea apista]